MTPLKPLRLFRPILAGATLQDRAIGSLGVFVCLLVTGLVCARSPFTPHDLPVVVAPVAASAVLLLLVPASPLAQPWPILGGNVLSGVVGVLVARYFGHSAVAMASAVALAILAMSLLRCLHPPGGAVAMSAVVGGAAIGDAGFGFPFGIVAVNSLVLILAGWLFHRTLRRHSYPHRPGPLAPATVEPHHLHRADINLALADVGEAFDVSPEDLEILLERAEHYARLRTVKPPAGRRLKRS